MKFSNLVGCFIIYIYSLAFIKADETDVISTDLSKLYTGKLEFDNSWRFYELEIPPGTRLNSKDLVFRVKESRKADSAQEDFSDPDIYVSTVRKAKIKFKLKKEN
jgi:hypothetical protein